MCRWNCRLSPERPSIQPSSTGAARPPTAFPLVFVRLDPSICNPTRMTSQASSIQPRIWLSPPHLTGSEQTLVMDAMKSNWIAPLGPHVDAFEREFADTVGSPFAVALSSGTAALHLSLLGCEVEPGDEIITSTLTFAATVFPVRYLGATPVFVDADVDSWNLDPALLSQWLEDRARGGRLPKAVVPVHLYGQSCDMASILEACEPWGIPVIEDAAEALGASYHGRAPGSFGRAGVFSFNGNKIITTSGGGMLVTADARLAQRVRKLATQAREPAPHYEHAEVGYNYRLSNLCAAVGRAQLETLDQRVAARRANFAHYVQNARRMPRIDLSA